MNEISKNDFDALKKELEGLKKSHRELLEILMKLADGLRGFARTERELDKLSKETLSTRRKVYYETFNAVYLKISNLKYR
jgi:hypothetical protein